MVKLVKRGQPLSAATEVYRGKADDGGYGVTPMVLRESDGKVAALIVQRPLDTFNAEYHLITDRGAVKLDLPTKSTIQGYVAGRLLVSLERRLARSAQGFRQEGDLVDLDLGAVKATPGAPGRRRWCCGRRRARLSSRWPLPATGWWWRSTIT